MTLKNFTKVQKIAIQSWKNAVKGVVEVQYGKGVICFKKVQSMMKKVSYNTECAEKCRNMPSKVA